MATFSGTDRLRDLQAFDDTKAGVKGLVDAGVTAVPYFFRHHPDPLPIAAPSEAAAAILVIDLAKADVDRGHVVSQLASVALSHQRAVPSFVPARPTVRSSSRLTTRARPHMATVSGTDRLRDLHAFDDTKAGVKGLVDAGVTTVPYFFRHHPDPLPVAAPSEAAAAIPLIDLAKADVDRGRVVAEVRAAAETVGFFQVVNHGVAGELMEEMLAAVRRFHEEPLEAKVPYYTRDVASKVRFNSNFDLFRNGFRSPAANWRDTMFVEMFPEAPSPEEIPPPCRGVLEVYAAAVRRLGERLFELLSEALGLPVGYLGRDAGCRDGLSLSVAAHYYPACPEPEATMGATKHSDPSFLTVLLQDTSGGLQAVLPRPPEERWVCPRPCVPVVVGGGGARAAAVYRSTTAGEFLAHYNGKGLDGRSALDHFRIPAAAASPPPPPHLVPARDDAFAHLGSRRARARAHMATVSGTDCLRDLQAFDDTKAGVKGLVDAGVTAVPYFFRHHPDPLPVAAPSEAAAAIPLIDLAKADVDRGRVVAEVRTAAKTVGFFQVVNHGVDGELMDEMLAAVRRFNEEPLEAKVPYYTRDVASKVRFNSNFDLFRSPAANWRDTMFVEMFPDTPSPEEIPPPCRGVLEEYAAAVRRLGELLFELLSEALGLPAGYLGRDAGCTDGLSVAAHYYPACPEPEATMGATKHSDPSFLT
uniref:Fe2OG dioxygenase domain-containing protein n=1 Tax=Oryza glumipatula TaxID=40148 RepID=A0A0E0AIE9_9ORYZ